MMVRRSFLITVGVGVAGLSNAALSTLLAQAETLDSVPASGTRRWAMLIDTRLCAARTGCRACIDACHSAHSVPLIPAARHAVKWLWKESCARIFPDQLNPYAAASLRERRLPVMCNHCSNPPCVRVCPTNATWQRPDGVVMMDEHRCIGCRYCMVACPYGARSFNWRDPRPFLPTQHSGYPNRTQGVVEKCTFCAERLREGLVPACVEACQHAGAGALRFGDLNEPDNELVRLLATRATWQRKPSLGTGPNIYYLV